MIYIVRHGQTDWNKEKVMQGQTDIPLNETGKEQAREQGEKLKDIVFDYIFCSPLTRTKQTLENLNVKCETKIIYDDRLKERNYGEFEKTPKSSFDYNLFWNHFVNKKYLKAECCQDFFKRVISLFEEIKKKCKDKNVLIVTHAGITKVAKCYFDGWLKDEEIGPYLPNNAEILIYNFQCNDKS